MKSQQGDEGLYDLVCCSQSIGEAEDKLDYLQKCITMIKPGGYLFLKMTQEDFYLRYEDAEPIIRKSKCMPLAISGVR